MAGPFSVTILGTSSAVAAYGRMPSAQALNHADRHLLIDCGEGTQFQWARYKLRLSRLQLICISHLHGDHVFGLPGLLTTLALGGRAAPLTLLGPPGLAALLEGVQRHTGGRPPFPLYIHEHDPGQLTPDPLWQDDALSIYGLPLDHRMPTLGYLFRERPKPLPFLPHQAQLHDVPVPFWRLLKLGNAVTLPDGRTITPDLVTGPALPCHSYAYCSDTRYLPTLAAALQGVTVLYHEATFTAAEAARAHETGHSTTLQAAQLAAAAGAGQLLIGHFSARYPDLQPLLAEARTIFPQTHLAQEGLTFSISA